MENSTAIDSNLSITLDETDSDIITTTETTAINVAIGSTTFAFCSDSTTINNDICATIYSCQRTTAID